MHSIYKKDFVFQAVSYEEYQNGNKTASGTTSVKILAKVLNPETLGIAIQGYVPVSINDHFGLPIFGAYNGDVLEDRIQYGRLPGRLSWNDPAEPVVCEIFNTMRCIRFAMLSPLRIVEFTGRFIDHMRIELINIRQAAETLLKEYKDFGTTLSPFNPFSRFSFAEKQPLFEAKYRALLNSYGSLNVSGFSSEERQEYEQLHALLLELKNEIF